MNSKAPNLNFILAFVCGVAIISIELLIGKLLSAIFGASLFIWTSIIGITLMSLAFGYFYGGWLSNKVRSKRFIPSLFTAAALFMITGLFFYPFLVKFSIGLPMFLGLFVLTSLLIFPALFLLGSVEPLLIQALNQSKVGSGFDAGRVYTVSTIGGVLGNYLLGFLLIPKFGVKLPLMVVCFFIALTAFFLVRNKRTILGILIVSVLIVMTFFLSSENDLPDFKVIYSSDGLLGKLDVVDRKNNKDQSEQRVLYSNNSGQSFVVKGDHNATSVFRYVHFISTISSLKPKGSRVLLLGMAGGSLVNELSRLGFEIDVVDIDPRVFDVAEDYFYANKSMYNAYVDDGRHFIKVANEDYYDIVIIDISSSEVQPSHLYTKECFTEIHNSLKDDGMLLVNYQGLLNGNSPMAIASWSLFKTLESSGFNTFAYDFENKAIGDVEYVATKKRIDLSKINLRSLNICCANRPEIITFINRPRIASKLPIKLAKKIPLLVDNNPILEKLKFEGNLRTREKIIRSIIFNQYK